MSSKTKVIASRLPIPLADQLEEKIEKDDKSLLIRILLEDFFAGKLFYSKSRFEVARKARSNGNNQLKRII